jgi:hypothetical protein
MVAALGRDELTRTERTEWLDGFRTLVQACPELGMPDGYARFMNVKHTLRALYFLLHDRREPWAAALADGVLALLGEFAEL